jgi:hypothetical protein
MGSLPPSKAREFEERIMVSHGGIEYMAGGTECPIQRLDNEPWSAKARAKAKAKARATPKSKSLGKRKVKSNPTPRPDADVCLTTPISSYTVKVFHP